MIAILEAHKAGLLRRASWLNNIIAGLVVGVVALPLAMAFAIASGAKPEHGIYTAIIAGLAVSLFGGSRVQVAGPTGAFVVILGSITAQYGIAGLQVATLMAGFILLLFGLVRLGSIIKYIPAPVIVGFTTGIAVLIWVGQWSYFLGLPAAPGTGHFHEKLLFLLSALPRLHMATALMGVGSLAILLLSPKVLPKIPAPLLALVAATVFQALFPQPGVATIGSAFGGIPQQLPHFSLPHLELKQVLQLLGPAFTIAMLGAIESLLSAVVADGMTDTRHNSNQELIGQGIANILAPLFGGFAATGAIARTATNVRNGATGPLAGIVHCVTLLAIVLLLAPLASAIPLACLAAILFVVAWNMSELPHFLRMLTRAPKADIGVLLITFALTVFADLVVAVNTGVIISSLLFMRRMAQSVEVNALGAQKIAQEHPDLHIPDGVLIYSIDGPFFFGAAETFERVLAQTHTDPEMLVIRLLRVPFMDITGLQTLEEMIERLRRRGTRVVLCEANARVRGKLLKAGIADVGGARAIFPDLRSALQQVEKPLV